MWNRKRRTSKPYKHRIRRLITKKSIDRTATTPPVSNVRARFTMIETAINRGETAPLGNTTGAFDVWRLLRSSPADEIKLLRPPAKRNLPHPRFSYARCKRDFALKSLVIDGFWGYVFNVAVRERELKRLFDIVHGGFSETSAYWLTNWILTFDTGA